MSESAEAVEPYWFETTVRVRYVETDKMGVVYHSNYFVWFEVARADLCRDCGFSYREMEIDDDAYMMVIDVRCRFRRPARYDDELLVRTRIADFSSRRTRFEYRVLRAATGELLAEGETSHVITTAEGRPRRFPEAQAALVLARLKG